MLWPLKRHGRACPGHPCIYHVEAGRKVGRQALFLETFARGTTPGSSLSRRGVDGRDKPGHDKKPQGAAAPRVVRSLTL
jgi:hypothetical protein